MAGQVYRATLVPSSILLVSTCTIRLEGKVGGKWSGFMVGLCLGQHLDEPQSCTAPLMGVLKWREGLGLLVAIRLTGRSSKVNNPQEPKKRDGIIAKWSRPR
ncbi:unnamed protein product [Protopolystoma xenopodis]|uniref:Uncharacterized protein n=1 Tax=Protopolystoma xenopodis TaxID=117903 RepID=A0A3S5FDF1_9PLAT|nr:unnamed protein product [Protopolystoma xenopodis]